MCMICRNVICPSNCPSYNDSDTAPRLEPEAEDEPVVECSACGKELYFGDTALILEDTVLCETCAAEATITLSAESDVRH